MSEFIRAWRSDLRDLIGHDFPGDLTDFILEPQAMFASAVLGVEEIDRIFRSAVDWSPCVKHEAESTV